VAHLELSRVVKRFDSTTILHGIDLRIEDGEFVVFVGPSGCGKSTLLRVISGLESPTSGDILIDGVNVNAVSAAHRGCAMVFQSYALYPHMTVYDNMAFGLENLGEDKLQIQAKVQSAAAQLRLQDLLQRKPTQLSGGQRQRVAIGRAIVRQPKLFLFDEPLSNLDAELRVSMRSELRELHARLQATMVYVTHDQVEAMTLADRIVVLRDGKIEQVGTPLALYNRPANVFVAGFIGSPRMNFFAADVLRQSATTLQLPAYSHTVGLRPEHVLLDDAGPLKYRVQQVEQMGSTSLLRGTLAGSASTSQAPAHFEVVSNGQTSVRPGQTVRLSMPPAALHFFDEQGARLQDLTT
jgi:multiple sugar transport system ATP-binding protein